MIHYTPRFNEIGRLREAGSACRRRKTGVLIADDNPIVCALLKATLELHGFQAWTAFSGPEAVGLFSIHQDNIDVVLLDVRMPGDDGPQTLRALRKLEPTVRACFMTADPNFHDSKVHVQMGAAHLFQKPFQLGHLVQVLRAVAEETREAVG